MLRRVELTNFKAFERFSATFGESAFVVGPNSAGKSTLLSAVRLAASLLQQTMKAKVNRSIERSGNHYVGYSLDAERLGLIEENLRHEFRDLETSLAVHFDAATLTAIWPSEDDGVDPYFYLEAGTKPQPRSPAAIRAAFPTMAVVPVLAPLERTETVLEPSTVKRSWGGRLSSRHFRNQLNLLDASSFREFQRFVATWTPEIDVEALETRYAEKGRQLDLFFTETGRRARKEVCWAGDGIQVWLQVLHHVFSNRNVQVLVLDEPDIYLHADLQRRLVRLVESLGAQTVLASHSPEVLGEAATDNVVWVDKSRRRAVRGSNGLTMSAAAVGSQFNVRIARALRSRVALFVEGNDTKLFRGLARAAGYEGVADEVDLAVVPLEGFSDRSNMAPFKILDEELLEGTSFVILDRGYRSAEQCASVIESFGGLDIPCHIWKRKEIESYLLVASVIARVAGAATSTIAELLAEVVTNMRGTVQTRALAQAEEEALGSGLNRAAITERFEPAFELQWSNPETRLGMAPPREVISSLNARLMEGECRAISAAKLARRIRQPEIDNEITGVLQRIEELISS